MNNIYERIGGILHVTPVDETNGLIDSPNFIAAKTLVDRVLNAKSLTDLYPIFADVNQELINYINSQIIDDLHHYFKPTLELMTILTCYCNERCYKTLQFLLYQNLLTDELIGLLMQHSVVRHCSYDDFIYMYKRTSGQKLYKTSELITSALSGEQFEILKYLFANTPYDADEIHTYLRYSAGAKNCEIFHFVWNYAKSHGVDFIHLIGYSFIISTRNVVVLDFILSEYKRRNGYIYQPYMDEIELDAFHRNKFEIIYYLYKNKYIEAENVVSELNNRIRSGSGSIELIKLMETIIHECNMNFVINYDKILHYQMIYNISQELITHIITNHKDKLICRLEHYALIALMNNSKEAFKLCIAAGVDIHYDDNLYYKMYKHNRFENFADVFNAC